MSTTHSQVLDAEAITVTTSYEGNVSSIIEARFKDSVSLGFDIDAAASCTGLTFKKQVRHNDVWMDCYRNNAGTYELDEYTIPLTSNTEDQLRAIVLSLLGERDVRLDFKGVGAAATIQSIYFTAEQDATNQ